MVLKIRSNQVCSWLLGLLVLGMFRELAYGQNRRVHPSSRLRVEWSTDPKTESGHRGSKQRLEVTGPTGWVYFVEAQDTGSSFQQATGPETNARYKLYRRSPQGDRTETFAEGLRKPHQLIFDDLGHLFVLDALDPVTGAMGWYYVMEGADFGGSLLQRVEQGPEAASEGYQEKWAQPAFSGQAAFVFPPITLWEIAAQEIMAYTGTGLPTQDSFQFFASHYHRDIGQIIPFTCRPTETFFDFQWGVPMPASEAGLQQSQASQGGIYFSPPLHPAQPDQPLMGMRLFDPVLAFAPERLRTRQILQSDFSALSISTLLQYLEHPDRRVRQQSQSHLVRRGPVTLESLLRKSNDPRHLLARLHALWAVQSICQAHPTLSDTAGLDTWLKALIQDPVAAIRSTAVTMIGALQKHALALELASAMDDASAHVRARAVWSWGKLETHTSLETIQTFLARTHHQHPMLFHAGTQALTGMAEPADLMTWKDHPALSVRMGAVVALRRQRSDVVREFLHDADPLIILESARAIHDLAMTNAYPSLAALHDTVQTWQPACASLETTLGGESPITEPLMRRVYHSHYLLGESQHLRALLEVVEGTHWPAPIQWLCARWIKAWARSTMPPDPDKGISNDIERDPSAVELLLAPRTANWLREGNPIQKQLMLECLAILNWQQHAPLVAEIVRQSHERPTLRAQSLILLHQWKAPELPELIPVALVSNSAYLRKEAVLIQADLHPEDMVAQLIRQLETGTIDQQKQALRSMTTVQDRRVDAVLLHWLQEAIEGNMHPGLHDALHQTSLSRRSPAIHKLLKQWKHQPSKTPDPNQHP